MTEFVDNLLREAAMQESVVVREPVKGVTQSLDRDDGRRPLKLRFSEHERENRNVEIDADDGDDF